MSSPIPRDIPELPAIPDMAVVMPSYVPPTAVSPPVRRPAVAVFRLLTALVAATGITLALASALSVPTAPPQAPTPASVLVPVPHQGPNTAPLPSPLASPSQSLLPSLLQVLAHFTIQASLVLAAVTAVSAVRSWKAARPLAPSLRAAALLYVATAALIDQAFSSTARLTPQADFLLHTVTSALAALDWLLLTSPGGLPLRRAATPLSYPVAYLAATLALTAATTSRPAPLPHPFLDVRAHGYLPTIGNALLIALSCYTLSALLAALDSVRPDLTRLRPRTGFRLRPPVG